MRQRYSASLVIEIHHFSNLNLHTVEERDLGILEIYNFSQIYECSNCVTEHYYCVWEITVLFLAIHKWEPDIYIAFSPALHFQCRDIPMR